MNFNSSARRLKALLSQVLLIPALLCVVHAGEPVPWHPAKGPLMTRWAAEVSPTNVLTEYPRPQLVRADWLNLNGLWDYAITPDTTDKPSQFDGKILVPFPVESALSGVMTNLGQHSKLWYRRSVGVPESWRGRRVRLHFGAVDWHCQVQVNGKDIGQHQGGYDAFAFDITEVLRWNGSEEITVCAVDPTEGDQPRGKQTRKPDGIFYTSSSGIWQTVWLEPVPEVCIDRLKSTPDLEAASLHLFAGVNSLLGAFQIEAVASVAGKEVGRATGLANTELLLHLPDPHLWSPEDPFLYDLKVTLKEGQKTLDCVTSYFGMRKVGLRKDEQGFPRITINDRFIFLIGTLDQGFWPDGIYTAPTDQALRSDIEFLKKSGFNLTRKHVKVEPDRWYYWCDKLGLLVWQDMPSANNVTVDGRREFENELVRLVGELQNHPSIMTWVLFNEGWGQYDTEQLTQWLKELDPSSLIDNASGWTDMHVGDLVDMHNYPMPDCPSPDSHRATVLGEYGGFGLIIPDHMWSSQNWGYVMLADKDELAVRYARALKQVWRLHNSRGLSAAIYTQTADVETEINGLQTYDRAVAKIDPSLLRAANGDKLFEQPMKVILANAMFGRMPWRYTTEKPPEDWFKPQCETLDWKEGLGAFGSTGTPGLFLNTVWETSDIWMRREFTLAARDMAGIKVQLFHDEDVEVYLNGVLAVQLPGFITDYEDVDISKDAAAALRPGNNTIAVHCHQTTAGQGIDVGLMVPQLSNDLEKK